MKKVGVVFGGVTCEHDVSIVTGLQLIENIDRKKYEVIPIYIHSDGEWYIGDELLDINIYKNFNEKRPFLKKGVIVPNKPGIMVFGVGLFGKDTLINLDVVIPAIHGMNGEDGTLQGLLELANIPYTSSGVLGASVGMDKILMKNVFESRGLPVLPYTYLLRGEWEADKDAIIYRVESKLSYPMFVKPSNLGSSIGISKVKNREDLINAIDVAVSYDERVIVERGVENLKEVNCSALGRADEVKVSVCEEPVNWAEFLTFDDKYLRGGKSAKGEGGVKAAGSKGMSSMTRKVPADITEEQTNKIQEYTVSAFKALNSKGVVRIDYIIDNDEGKVYINEINTVPGSFAFYLWSHNGEYSYSKLIDEIIDIAEKEHKEKMRNNYTFNSNIIESQNDGVKSGSKM